MTEFLLKINRNQNHSGHSGDNELWSTHVYKGDNDQGEKFI